MNEITGVVQRRSSSTAEGISDRSARRAAHWSGRSARATRPPEIRFRVVSLPGHQQLDQEHGQLRLAQLVAPGAGASAPFSGSDPTLASTDTRSSAGAARRSSATPTRYPHISACKLRPLLLGSLALPGITASDHSKKRGHCDPSTPEQLADHLQGERDGERLHHVDRLTALDGVDQRLSPSPSRPPPSAAPSMA